MHSLAAAGSLYNLVSPQCGLCVLIYKHSGVCSSMLLALLLHAALNVNMLRSAALPPASWTISMVIISSFCSLTHKKLLVFWVRRCV